jgi:hypothetical protein
VLLVIPIEGTSPCAVEKVTLNPSLKEAQELEVSGDTATFPTEGTLWRISLTDEVL